MCGMHVCLCACAYLRVGMCTKPMCVSACVHDCECVCVCVCVCVRARARVQSVRVCSVRIESVYVLTFCLLLLFYSARADNQVFKDNKIPLSRFCFSFFVSPSLLLCVYVCV